jgi:hypothetical protein
MYEQLKLEYDVILMVVGMRLFEVTFNGEIITDFQVLGHYQIHPLVE